MADTKKTSPETLATLEIIGFDEIRGVVARRAPGVPDRIEELQPTLNEVTILHVRFPGGPLFCVTLDGNTFGKVGNPLLSGILRKSEELRDSRSKMPSVPPTSSGG
jgi:hypothetical protein